MELTGISPSRPHPAQGVLLTTTPAAHIGDHIQLTDARGRHSRIAAGVSSQGLSLTLPDDVADGEAIIRLERRVDGEERLSAPLTFFVTSGPSPLKPSAAALMKPVSPGQWTDLVKDHEIEFEVRRADRIDVEFQQGAMTEVSRATGPDNVHVHVPARLLPGRVSVRTRTWIERTASEWSAPITFSLLERAVSATIIAIEAGPTRNLVWWSGDAAPARVEARPGDTLVLRRHFPVANAGAALRVQLRGARTTLELRASDVDGGVRIEIPSEASPEDWRLVVAATDGRTPPAEVTTVRLR